MTDKALAILSKVLKPWLPNLPIVGETSDAQQPDKGNDSSSEGQPVESPRGDNIDLDLVNMLAGTMTQETSL